MSTYAAKLRDPRWQRKRLMILERDGWACQSCFDKEKTLHVHHLYYERGNNPWDYPDSALLTLCEDCHAAESCDLHDAVDALVKALKKQGATSEHFHLLASEIGRTPEAPSGRYVDGFTPFGVIGFHIRRIIDLSRKDPKSLHETYINPMLEAYRDA